MKAGMDLAKMKEMRASLGSALEALDAAIAACGDMEGEGEEDTEAPEGEADSDSEEGSGVDPAITSDSKARRKGAIVVALKKKMGY